MSNKNIKTYNQFLSNSILLEESSLNDVETTTIINKLMVKKYNDIYINQILMEDIKNDVLYESIEDVSLLVQTNDWDKDPRNFYNSFMKSEKISFLTPYTIEELQEFDLYKIKGYDIGFAIKNGKEIILVHNNSNIKGIGQWLINKSIEKGGTDLDHFDGFLTGFYKKMKFQFKNNDWFNMDYTPENWKFEPINIQNPDTSIYFNELNVDGRLMGLATERYQKGMPDIIYRGITN